MRWLLLAIPVVHIPEHWQTIELVDHAVCWLYLTMSSMERFTEQGKSIAAVDEVNQGFLQV